MLVTITRRASRAAFVTINLLADAVGYLTKRDVLIERWGDGIGPAHWMFGIERDPRVGVRVFAGPLHISWSDRRTAAGG